MILNRMLVCGCATLLAVTFANCTIFSNGNVCKNIVLLFKEADIVKGPEEPESMILQKNMKLMQPVAWLALTGEGYQCKNCSVFYPDEKVTHDHSRLQVSNSLCYMG